MSDEKAQPEKTVVTTVGVKVTRKYDLGFEPYMAYLRELGGRSPAFGTRENANMELDVYLGADVGYLDSPDDVAAMLITKARHLIDANVSGIPGIPAEAEEAFTVERTEVTRTQEEF